MGFIIETYQLYGLPPLPNIYVSIRGTYTIQKNYDLPSYPNSSGLTLPYYSISFKVYYSACSEAAGPSGSPNAPVITQKDMNFNIQALPNPAVLYLIIYDYVKGQIDPYYQSNRQALSFTDD